MLPHVAVGVGSVLGRRWTLKRAYGWMAAIAMLGGCNAGDGDDETGSQGSETGDPTGGEALGPSGPMPLRRLNQVEYNNTVRDLLGDDSRPADDFTPDSPGESGFALAPVVTEVPARDLMRAAEALALKAVADLGELVPCDLVGKELECVDEFVTSFGRRAFRRPLAADEVTELVDLYKRARGELGLDVAQSMATLLQVILQSPRFLYHWELGPTAPTVDAGGAIALNDHELASRLSYFLWATMPDDELFAAADAGQLRDPEGFEAQVRRLISDPRARDAVFSFHLQWLNLTGFQSAEKDGTLFPQYGVDGVKESMYNQLHTFVNHVVFDAGGSLELLLSADYTFVDERLGNVIYFEPGYGEEMERLELDPEKPRLGLLGLPIVLATHSFFGATSPVKRGKMIRERLLCQPLPPPPPNVNNTPPMADFGKTTRGIYDMILAQKDCAGCHELMNPIGYGFENFDPMGRWRPSEFGELIDPSGWITGLPGDPTFNNAAELATILADSDEVRRCVATHWLRYALQRKEITADADALAEINQKFEDAGYDIRELILAVALSPAFRSRVPSAGEELAP